MGMTKIVISAPLDGNNLIGMFRLSDEAVEWLITKRGWKLITDVSQEPEDTRKFIFQQESNYIASKVEYVVPITTSMRSDEDLVACLEEMGKDASGYYSNLKIVEVPDDVDWELQICNGVEWIAEKHRVWR